MMLTNKQFVDAVGEDAVRKIEHALEHPEESKPHKRPPRGPVHPGEFIRDCLAAESWTQKNLAEIVDRPAQTVNEIINGKKALTPESATQLGAALGISPELLLHMQTTYRLWHLSQDERHLKQLEAIRQRAEDKDLGI